MSDLAAAESLLLTRLTASRLAQSNCRLIRKHSSWKNREANFYQRSDSRDVAVIDRDKGEVIATWKTDLAFGTFRWRWMKRIIAYCRVPSASKACGAQYDSGEWLQRSTSPAIPMMFL